MEPNVEELLDKLETYIISCENIVTYKWLSQEWNVHVNTAKQLLFSFVNKQRSKEPPVSLDVTYFLSGCLKDCDDGKSQQVSLVREKEIPAMKEKFKKVYSEHIYSISKSLKDLHEIYIVDQVNGNDVKEKIKTAAIKCEQAVPRRIEVVAKVSMNTASSAQNNVKVHNGSTGNDQKEVDAKKSENTNGNARKEINKKKPIKNFFAPRVGPPVTPKVKNELKKKVEPPQKMVEDAETKDDPFDSEEEVDVRREIFKNGSTKKETAKKETQEKKGRKKKKGDSAREEESPLPAKKRRRIMMMSSSEGSCDEDAGESESPLPSKEVIVSDDDDIIPATPQESLGLGTKRKKRKRTQISKTFTDEKGYIVTKKEFVVLSCSDDSSVEEERNEASERKKPEIEKSEASERKKPEIEKSEASERKKPEIEKSEASERKKPEIEKSEASERRKTEVSPKNKAEVISPEGRDKETKGKKKKKETEKGKKNGKFYPQVRQGLLTNFFKRN